MLSDFRFCRHFVSTALSSSFRLMPGSHGGIAPIETFPLINSTGAAQRLSIPFRALPRLSGACALTITAPNRWRSPMHTPCTVSTTLEVQPESTANEDILVFQCIAAQVPMKSDDINWRDMTLSEGMSVL